MMLILKSLNFVYNSCEFGYNQMNNVNFPIQIATFVLTNFFAIFKALRQLKVQYHTYLFFFFLFKQKNFTRYRFSVKFKEKFIVHTLSSIHSKFQKIGLRRNISYSSTPNKNPSMPFFQLFILPRVGDLQQIKRRCFPFLGRKQKNQLIACPTLH